MEIQKAHFHPMRNEQIKLYTPTFEITEYILLFDEEFKAMKDHPRTKALRRAALNFSSYVSFMSLTSRSFSSSCAFSSSRNSFLINSTSEKER